MSENKFSRALFFFTLGLIGVLALPKLFTRGMFMDGVIYSSISLNLSNGIGEIWAPYYDGLKAGTFYGHPPFFFWIQALWFQLIGNYHFTERLFDIAVLIITSILIFKTAKQFFSKSAALFSVILFIVIPKVVWTYDNNMMETVLPPLALGAFLLLKKRITQKRWWQLPLISALTVLFMLVKGPVGLGVLVLPFTFVFNLNLKSIFKDFLILLVLLSSTLFLLIQYEPAFNNISNYFNLQVLGTINGNTEPQPFINHFKIIIGLLEQLIIPSIVIAALLLTTKTKPNFNTKSLPLFLAGLLFSVPFALFSKQHIYYILPSFSFFAILFASISINSIKKIETISTPSILKSTNYVGVLMLIIATTLSTFNFHKPVRDPEMINAVHNVSPLVGNNKVSVSDDLKTKWGLFAYAARFSLVDFDYHNDNKFLFSTKNDLSAGYRKIEISNSKYFLYQKTD